MKRRGQSIMIPVAVFITIIVIVIVLYTVRSSLISIISNDRYMIIGEKLTTSASLSTKLRIHETLSHYYYGSLYTKTYLNLLTEPHDTIYPLYDTSNDNDIREMFINNIVNGFNSFISSKNSQINLFKLDTTGIKGIPKDFFRGDEIDVVNDIEPKLLYNSTDLSSVKTPRSVYIFPDNSPLIIQTMVMSSGSDHPAVRIIVPYIRTCVYGYNIRIDDSKSKYVISNKGIDAMRLCEQSSTQVTFPDFLDITLMYMLFKYGYDFNFVNEFTKYFGYKYIINVSNNEDMIYMLPSTRSQDVSSITYTIPEFSKEYDERYGAYPEVSGSKQVSRQVKSKISFKNTIYTILFGSPVIRKVDYEDDGDTVRVIKTFYNPFFFSTNNKYGYMNNLIMVDKKKFEKVPVNVVQNFVEFPEVFNIKDKNKIIRYNSIFSEDTGILPVVLPVFTALRIPRYHYNPSSDKFSVFNFLTSEGNLNYEETKKILMLEKDENEFREGIELRSLYDTIMMTNFFLLNGYSTSSGWDLTCGMNPIKNIRPGYIDFCDITNINEKFDDYSIDEFFDKLQFDINSLKQSQLNVLVIDPFKLNQEIDNQNGKIITMMTINKIMKDKGIIVPEWLSNDNIVSEFNTTYSYYVVDDLINMYNGFFPLYYFWVPGFLHNNINKLNVILDSMNTYNMNVDDDDDTCKNLWSVGNIIFQNSLSGEPSEYRNSMSSNEMYLPLKDYYHTLRIPYKISEDGKVTKTVTLSDLFPEDEYPDIEKVISRPYDISVSDFVPSSININYKDTGENKTIEYMNKNYNGYNMFFKEITISGNFELSDLDGLPSSYSTEFATQTDVPQDQKYKIYVDGYGIPLQITGGVSFNTGVGSISVSSLSFRINEGNEYNTNKDSGTILVLAGDKTYYYKCVKWKQDKDTGTEYCIQEKRIDETVNYGDYSKYFIVFYQVIPKYDGFEVRSYVDSNNQTHYYNVYEYSYTIKFKVMKYIYYVLHLFNVTLETSQTTGVVLSGYYFGFDNYMLNYANKYPPLTLFSDITNDQEIYSQIYKTTIIPLPMAYDLYHKFIDRKLLIDSSPTATKAINFELIDSYVDYVSPLYLLMTNLVVIMPAKHVIRNIDTGFMYSYYILFTKEDGNYVLKMAPTLKDLGISSEDDYLKVRVPYDVTYTIKEMKESDTLEGNIVVLRNKLNRELEEVAKSGNLGYVTFDTSNKVLYVKPLKFQYVDDGSGVKTLYISTDNS